MAKKKITKKVTSPAKIAEPIMAPADTPTTATPRLSPRFLTYALIVMGIGLLVYKFGPYFVPALVANKPITRFSIWSRLEKTYGTQTLDDLVNEAILDKAIANAGIKVEQAKVDAQLADLEKQFESLGGLDAALNERGLSKEDLVKQVKTQLSVEELLVDKINPTDEEIKKEFDNNASTLYKDKKLDDVKGEITTALKDAKLRDAFLTWFEEVKKSISVKSFGL